MTQAVLQASVTSRTIAVEHISDWVTAPYQTSSIWMWPSVRETNLHDGFV